MSKASRSHLQQVFPSHKPDTPHAHTRTPTRPQEPSNPISILDSNFRYASAVETDLAAKFKAMGFKAKPQRPKFKK
jgi:hypothetical protein